MNYNFTQVIMEELKPIKSCWDSHNSETIICPAFDGLWPMYIVWSHY